MGIFLIAFALSHWFWLSLCLLFLIGVTYNASTTLNGAILQEMVVDRLRGRIMALREVPFGIGPGGAIVAGSFAGLIGAPLALGAVGVVPLIFVGAVILLSPSVTRVT